jgi:hypothetical protein
MVICLGKTAPSDSLRFPGSVVAKEPRNIRSSRGELFYRSIAAAPCRRVSGYCMAVSSRNAQAAIRYTWTP